MYKEEIARLICGLFPRIDKAADDCALPLTGSFYRLSAAELLYLFTMVEARYGITITEDDLEQLPFTSVENISGLVALCRERA